jgi:hypothetical protein
VSGVDPRRTIHRRSLVLIGILAAGSILAAAVVVTLETLRALQPQSPLFASPPRETLAQAIQADDPLAAFAFVRAGQDPDALVAVRDARWTADQWVLVSPLMWAVTSDSSNSVLMLLTAGARLPHEQDRRAACFAEALGHPSLGQLLRAYAPHQLPQPCPKWQFNSAPLTAVVADSEQPHVP